MADTIRVLYVDDEPGLLDIGKLFLEKTGEYTVDTLESAIEALRQLKTKRYDAIISDYQMPDMDGIEFLKQLKASENTTPFIIFTGRGREDVVIQALNEGADFYLQKGGEPKSQFAELSNKIQYAVTRKRAEEALIKKNEELYASYEQITATEEELRTNLDKLTRQEMALKQSEERYRSVVNDQTEMIARFTPDGNLTFVNEAYRSYFASLLDIKDVKGHYIREILQVKNYAEVEKFLSSLSHKNPIREIERVVRGKDGEQHWQIWSVRALFAADGNPVEYQVVGRDVTEITLQKNTERELRRSEQRSLAVSMNAGSWIWEVDPNGIYRYTSPAVEQILGYRPDELVGKMHCYDLFDASLLEEQKATVLAIFNRHEPCRHFVMHARHRNGTPVVLNTSAIPVFKEDGTFSGYYGVNEDITERKRAEEALKLSEIHLAEAMDLAHLVSWEFDVRTGLFTFDDRFYALYGTTVEREGGNQISAEVYAREFVHPEDRDIVVKLVEKANKKTDLHCVSQLEHRIVRRDDEIRHIVVRIDVTKDAEGRIIKTHGVNQDITERKRAEEALRESRQILEAIINTVPVRVFWKDKNLIYLGCNPPFAHDAGFERPEDIIRKDDYAMGWSKQAEQYRADDRLVIESGRPRLLIEEPQTTPSGEEIYLLTSKVPLKNATGEVIGVLGTYFDITERKITESAIQAIVKSMVGSTGLNSLRKITESISAWLGAECVMVGEIQPDNQTVNVLSMLLDGKEIPDYSYTLKGTPCDDVAERGFCLYPDNVITLFPESKDLVELNIRGYIGTPLRNSNGQVCGILCALFRSPVQASPSMREIMEIIAVKASSEIERNQIERALRESQQMLAEAMDLAHLVHWEFDVRTGIFTFDDRFYALYGTTGEREGGNQMSAEEYAKRFLYPDDQNKVNAEVNKALQATDPGYTSLVGHRIIRRDGEIRHIIVRIRITKDENGRTIKTHGANQDITELMRVENALRESEERYRQLVENLNDIVYTVDNNGIVTYVSPVVERQYGYSSSDLFGKPFTEVVFKDDIPNLQKRFAEMGTGIIVPFEWRLKHKDGSLSWVRSSTRPLRDDHGTSGFLGIVSDITREKQAEQALRESEARARAMIQAIPDLVFRMDRQGVFLDYKADVSDLYAQSEPTLVGRRNQDITPPEFADLIDLQIRTVLETGTTQTFEYELPIPGRGVRNYEARMVASGLNEVTAIVRDITERKLAEEALAESESFNRGLVENLPEYLSVYGSDGILLYVNPASANAWGFEAEEMVGTHVLSYIPLEYHKLVNANIAVRQKGGDISPYEIEIITKNAVRRSVIVKATPIQYQNNPAILLLLIDITERKRAEKALFEAAQYTRKLIEVSLDSLVTISPEGRITDVNAATEQVTGYSRDYLIGTDFSDYFTDLVRAKEGYRKVFDQGVVLDYPLEIRHKDGKITSVLYNATVYRDGTGNVQGVFAAARDITERKRVEDALKMANKKLSILSSITRHDINNQLAVLTGYLRILEKKQPDPTLSVYSQKVAAAAQRISTMILFTKEYEQLGVEGPVWQDIGKISKMAAVDLLPENVDLKINTGNFEIFADPMFMLVLYNLFENAIRHGVHVTEITLHFIEEESSGMLIVEDNGVGIPAPIKERIFERGFGTNTGFGLYLIRQILPITGLSITETGTEGKGARFEIHLPPGTWRRGPG